MEKLIVILGPTSSGKSSLGIKLARLFKGEIVSADSRQVYKGMDIGTGKVSKTEQKLVPHHLIDVASPKKQFTVADFKRLALEKIEEIQERGHLPFIVGGTAFYIYALLDNSELPAAKPSQKLRKSLEKKTTEELFIILKNLDPRRAKTIDRNNRPRLIRAIEINIVTGKPVPEKKDAPDYTALILGITHSQPKLYKLIDDRLEGRMDQGMIREVKKLLKTGLTHKKLQTFGLEYRYISLHLQGKLSYEDMLEKLKNEIHHFAKRQMTWFKKDQRIKWVKNQSEAAALIKRYLKN